MNRSLSSSKQSQVLLLRLLEPRNPTVPLYPLLRHLCTEPNPPPPPPPQDEDSLITKAVQLLQVPENENENSSSTQLHQLLFSSSSPSSPGLFRQSLAACPLPPKRSSSSTTFSQMHLRKTYIHCPRPSRPFSSSLAANPIRRRSS
ncbi:hypothetical protein SLA2020_431440 [Shorea laevis]